MSGPHTFSGVRPDLDRCLEGVILTTGAALAWLPVEAVVLCARPVSAGKTSVRDVGRGRGTGWSARPEKEVRDASECP